MLRDGPDDRDVRLPLETATGDGGGETEVAWQQFHLHLRAFVSRRVKQRADAEDIVQKVFMEMQRSLGTLRTRDRLGAWLYQAARNAVIDHYRTPAKRREVSSGDTRDLEIPSPWMASSDDVAVEERQLAANCLTPMIERLPEPYRRAIELVELRGVTQRAAAEAEGLSVSGMKSRVQRARERLKAALLECCHLALDARGGVMSCESHQPGKGCRSACDITSPRKA
jgi:RNA polymerase sigma-70 factor (ECF subfamily)